MSSNPGMGQHVKRSWDGATGNCPQENTARMSRSLKRAALLTPHSSLAGSSSLARGSAVERAPLLPPPRAAPPSPASPRRSGRGAATSPSLLSRLASGSKSPSERAYAAALAAVGGPPLAPCFALGSLARSTPATQTFSMSVCVSLKRAIWPPPKRPLMGVGRYVDSMRASYDASLYIAIPRSTSVNMMQPNVGGRSPLDDSIACRSFRL
mmetsp:Transcript_20308/g.60351  ORF Transcript_20308/g.60351 Transcript_20308/m.60351 type:complete len:210 (-) Transcript_20308:618-1247(-)